MNNPKSEFITMAKAEFEAAKQKVYDEGFRDGYLKCGAEHTEKSRHGFNRYLSPDSMWRAQCMDAIQKQRVAESHALHTGKRFL